MGMRKIIGVLFLSVALIAQSQADIEDAVANLKVAMAVEIETSIGDDVSRNLKKSGMADSDVAKTMVELSEKAASCFVDALVSQANEQSLDAEQVLSNADASIGKSGGTDLPDGLDIYAFEEKLEYCILLAFESVGVDISLVAP